jgi:hypothetical protein
VAAIAVAATVIQPTKPGEGHGAQPEAEAGTAGTEAATSQAA